MTEETLRRELPRSRASMLDVIENTLNKAGVDVLMTLGDWSLCRAAALAGCPIGNVPLGFAHEYNGRALGMHILVRPDHEKLLVDVMAAWENTCPWTREPPPILVNWEE